MSKAYAVFLAAVLALALTVASAAAIARELDGRVVGIQDGDTLTVLDVTKQQHRIRLAGIDAPEKTQAFGEAARENLARLAFGKPVEVRCGKRDRYGRDVCNVYSHGRDVGLEQVRGGYAWWYRQYAREQSADERVAYETAEQEARQARRGLWRETTPTAPWAWRRQSRG